VKLWNKDGTLLRTLEGHTHWVLSVAWSPDGTTLASGSYKEVKLWNKDATLLRTLEGHSNDVWSVAWSPDGTTLASGSEDGTIRLWR
jgi:WD40 repeat protein